MIVVLRSGQITDVGTYDELVGKGINFHEFDLKEKANDCRDEEEHGALLSGESHEGVSACLCFTPWPNRLPVYIVNFCYNPAAVSLSIFVSHLYTTRQFLSRFCSIYL